MNILLSKYSKTGLFSMRQQLRYNFCSQTPTNSFKPPNNRLMLQLSKATRFSAVLDIFEAQKDQFMPDHFSLACRIISKSFESNDKLFGVKNPIVNEFVQSMNKSIPFMDENQISNLLYLLKRQRLQKLKPWNLNQRLINDRVNQFIESNSLTNSQIATIFSSMLIIGVNANGLANLVIQRLTGQTHHEYSQNFTVRNALEIIGGFSLRGFFLTGIHQKCIIEIIKYIDKNNTEIEPHLAISLLKAFSKLNINDGQPAPFFEKVAKIIMNEKDLSEEDILNIFESFADTNFHAITRIAIDLRKKYFEGIAQDPLSKNVMTTIKVLARLQNWRIHSSLSGQEQNAVVKQFEAQISSPSQHYFKKSIFDFLMMLKKQNAKIIMDKILNFQPDPSLYLLSIASKYTKMQQSRLIKIIQRRQKLEILDLLSLHTILRDEEKLDQKLLQIKKKIPELVKQSLKQYYNLAIVRLYLKQVFSQSSKQIKDVIVKQIISLPDNKFLPFIGKPEFVFTLVQLFKGNEEAIRNKIETVEHNKIFNQRIIHGIIKILQGCNIRVIDNFWYFAKAFNIPPKDILYGFTSLFVNKNNKHINRNHSYVEWIIQTLSKQNPSNIFLSNLLQTLSNSTNPFLNKSILRAVILNISRYDKIQKHQIIQLTKAIKREGMLNRRVCQLFVKQFPHIQNQLPIFFYAFLENKQLPFDLEKRYKNIRAGSLQILLLFDINLWKENQKQVQQFIQNIELPNDKWKSVLTSIRGRLRQNEDYKKITDTLIINFLKHLSYNDYSSLNVIQRLAKMTSQIVIKHGLQSIKKKLFAIRNFRVAESLILILNDLEKQDILIEFFKTPTDMSNETKYLLLEKANIRIDSEIAKHLIKAQSKPKSIFKKEIFFRIFMLHDYLPEIQNYIMQNKEYFNSICTSTITGAYFRAKYLNSQQQYKKIENVECDLQPQTLNELQNAVQKTGCEFELNPVINNHKVSFRIGENYFLAHHPMRFVFLPPKFYSPTSQKLMYNYELSLRLLRMHTDKNIIAVPTQWKGLKRILIREEFSKYYRAKEEIQDVEEQYEVENEELEESASLKNQINEEQEEELEQNSQKQK